MFRVRFLYDPERDADNLIRGARSVNNPAPTKLQSEFLAVHGPGYDPGAVRTFLADHARDSGFDGSALAAGLAEAWSAVEDEFFTRAGRMFPTAPSLAPVTAYLTTNQRCTYDIEAGYFFVNPRSPSPVRIVMHELLHFYTWFAHAPELFALGVSEAVYNDVKESLTELLNLEFADLMPGARDDGYPQHAAMRDVVRSSWLAHRDVRRTMFDALALPIPTSR